MCGKPASTHTCHRLRECAHARTHISACCVHMNILPTFDSIHLSVQMFVRTRTRAHMLAHARTRTYMPPTFISMHFSRMRGTSASTKARHSCAYDSRKPSSSSLRAHARTSKSRHQPQLRCWIYLEHLPVYRHASTYISIHAPINIYTHG